MEKYQNDYGEQCQFDAYCKLILSHEAIDYLRELKRFRDREVSWSDISQTEADKFSTIDQYACEDFIFSSHGIILQISDELVANAFSELSAEVQAILILKFALDMTDEEVGNLIGLPHYTVKYRRRCALDELREKLSPLRRRRN